jgi:uncharacterized membrane protein
MHTKMSPLERLLWAIAPVQRRSMSLVLGSVTVFAIAGAVAMFVELPRAINAWLALIMLAAWFVGVCGMVGYFRWVFSPSSYRQNGTESTRPKE